MVTTLETIWVALTGLAAGSFVNVCVHRLPRGESLSYPPSACPICTHPIRWRDNIPVLSWLLLRGQCRDCGERISAAYPLTEIAAAALAVLTLQRFGWSAPLPWYAAFQITLLAGAVIDGRYGILPDGITLGGAGVALVLAPFARPHMAPESAWVEAGLGAAVTMGALWLLRAAGTLVFRRESMGLGDVKLGAFMGAVLGWRLALLAVYIGYVLTLAVLLRRPGGWGGVEIRSGPFFAAGTVVALYAGDPILEWIFGGW